MELINQSVFMAWEAILENALLVIAILTLLVVPWAMWLFKASGTTKQHYKAFIGAGIIAVLGFFTLPMAFKSSLGDLTYWLDWAFHIVMVFGLFFYSYLVLLPVLSIVKAPAVKTIVKT